MVYVPVDRILSYVFLTTVVGLRKNPSNAAFEPKCVMELKTATLLVPKLSFVPIRFANL